MKYQLFLRLYSEAKEYQDVDFYVAERGWQDWMEKFDEDKVSAILHAIYDIAQLNARGIRDRLGLTQSEMAKAYYIPSSSLQNWEYGNSEHKNYMLYLLAYTVFCNEMEDLEDGRVEEQD